jgi:hypothetical protein
MAFNSSAAELMVSAFVPNKAHGPSESISNFNLYYSLFIFISISIFDLDSNFPMHKKKQENE